VRKHRQHLSEINERALGAIGQILKAVVVELADHAVFDFDVLDAISDRHHPEYVVVAHEHVAHLLGEHYTTGGAFTAVGSDEEFGAEGF
jgi:hypothetical protein